MKEFKGTPAPWMLFSTMIGYEVTAEDETVLAVLIGKAESKEANANLIEQAPKMLEHGEKLNELIKKAQSIIVEYLVPDGIDEAVAMDLLVELFDCPEQHEAQTNWDETVNKAVGG